MPRLEAPENGVRIRMYKHGFGDCFLLTFRGRDGRPVHCLIDCGVHTQWRPFSTDPNQKRGSERLNDVVEHIHGATGGHLDVVVVTHEHADHLSGFYSARHLFAKLTVGEVWMGWTEDPQSVKARNLDKTRGMMMTQLRAMGMSLAANDVAFDNVAQVMGFFDIPQEGDDRGRPLAFGARSRDARDQAQALSSNHKFLRPHGEPHQLPGVEGVRVFVLGPPEDERLLMSARPTGQPGEVYESEGDHGEPQPLGAGDRIDFTDAADTLQPFARNHRRPVEWVETNQGSRFDYYHEFYGFPTGDEPDPMAWRRIGGELEAQAQDLALRLDSATNNTSLVLAFELSEGRVLLFPGDAQVGNWKSWHLAKWTEENGLEKGEVITAADLLERTVLYKVAHHGSHNATLKEKGLELMTSAAHPHLAAMIPVDEQWALGRRPHKWSMPYAPLYDDLVERTRGKILRADRATPPRISWDPFVKPDDPVGGEYLLYTDLIIPDEPDRPSRDGEGSRGAVNRPKRRSR